MWPDLLCDFEKSCLCCLEIWTQSFFQLTFVSILEVAETLLLHFLGRAISKYFRNVNLSPSCASFSSKLILTLSRTFFPGFFCKKLIGGKIFSLCFIFHILFGNGVKHFFANGCDFEKCLKKLLLNRTQLVKWIFRLMMFHRSEHLNNERHVSLPISLNNSILY